MSPDVVWNDSDVGIQAASGGGSSAVFNRPDFQGGVKSLVGNQRGTPDVSLNAAVNGGVWVYYTFVGPASPYHIFGGTSAAAPEFAGIVAMADQVAGQWLGTINKALYSIPYGGGLVDVTSGNNDIGPFTNSDGVTYHVPGFDAAARLRPRERARHGRTRRSSLPGRGGCGGGRRPATAALRLQSSSMSFATFRGDSASRRARRARSPTRGSTATSASTPAAASP